MTERFIYTTGTISVTNGASVVTGTGTAWGGKDREAAWIIALPDAAAPVLVGLVAAVDPVGDYEDLELPLAAPYSGMTLSDVTYMLVDGMAMALGARQAAVFSELVDQLRTKGLAFDVNDSSVDYTRLQPNSIGVDTIRNKFVWWKDGSLVDLDFTGPFNTQGLWDPGYSDRFALSISSSETAINYANGSVHEYAPGQSAAYFKLTVNANTEIQPPTNVSVGDVFEVRYDISGVGRIISHDPAYSGNLTINTADGSFTRKRYTVTAESSGTATAVTASTVTFAKNDLVEHEGRNFASNVDANGAEPPGSATSTASWTHIPATAGEDGHGLQIDAVGTFAGRTAFDNETAGFIYCSTDGDGGLITDPVLFRKESGAGVWSDPIPFLDVGDIPGAVEGPASATDNALARFDGTTGELLQDSTATLTDTGHLTIGNPSAPADVLTLQSERAWKFLFEGAGGADTQLVLQALTGTKAFRIRDAAGAGGTLAFEVVTGASPSVSAGGLPLVRGTAITNMRALTQATYNGLTPDATTLYVITDA